MCKRRLARLRYITDTLVKWDAIWQVFDADPNMADKEFELTDLFMCGKFLKSSTCHATLAMGMLENQYENKLVHNVIAHWKDTVLQDSVPIGAAALVQQGMSQAMQPFINAACMHDGEYYYFSTKGTEPAQAKGAVENSSHVRFNWLAQQTYEEMKHSSSRPSREDLTAVIHRLSNIQVPKEGNNPNGTTIVALDVASDRFKIASSMVDTLQKNILRICLETVLNYQGAQQRSYLYGCTKDALPFIVELLRVRKKRKRRAAEIEDQPEEEDDDPLMFVYNASTFHPEIDRMVSNLTNVNNRRISNPIDLQQRVPVDQEIEDFGTLQHLFNNMGPGWDLEQMMLDPCAHILIRNERELSKCDRSQLIDYPPFKVEELLLPNRQPRASMSSLSELIKSQMAERGMSLRPRQEEEIDDRQEDCDEDYELMADARKIYMNSYHE